MRTISVKYPTITKQVRIGDKVYIVEAIRDLDEAIDIICAEMSPDEQLDPFAEDLCPYFGILWPSSIALGMYLDLHPELVKGKSVLELGSGLGLPSLVASHLGGKVLTTDYHPDVESYFQRNCRHSSVDCEYKRLNWRDSANEVGQFDVVIGSDVLYESKHAHEVADGLLRFLKPNGTMILSDPGRAYLQRFLNAMVDRGVKEDMSLQSAHGKDIFIFKFCL